MLEEFDDVNKPTSTTSAASSSSSSHPHLTVVSEKCAPLVAALRAFRRRLAFLARPLFSKCPYDMLSAPVFCFVKFAIVTALQFLLGYYFVRALDINHDRNYTWAVFRQLDLAPIIGDLVIFYFIGELNGTYFQGADTLGWILCSTLSMISLSLFELDPEHVRGTISLYAIHCLWGPGIFFAVSVALFFISALVVMHLYRAFVDRTIIPKFSKLVVCMLAFVAPVILSPSLHIHHWWWTWILGMHANQHNYWWSTMSSAILLGLYLNGVSTYGRDPILGCAESLYRSLTSDCEYINCYIALMEATPSPTPMGQTAAPTANWEWEEANWKNCSDPKNKHAYNP